MNKPAIDNTDLRVFAQVVRCGSFVGAADELGVSPAYVSKRVQVLEKQLGAKLLHRTTRQVALTDEGDRVCQWAERILDDLDQMQQEVRDVRVDPRGTLRVCSSFGLGRELVAPAVSALVARYRQLDVRLQLVDRLFDVAAEGYDLDIRMGAEFGPNVIVRRLLHNERVLCAAPRYLQEFGVPRSLDELRQHNCLVNKERDRPFGVWRLERDGREDTVKVTGSLSSNNGEVVLDWAAEGHGIILHSLWPVSAMLAEGKLQVVLPEYRQAAHVWAVYPTRLERSAKLRVAVEFFEDWFRQRELGDLPDWAVAS